jgi:hypothetical protein
LTGYLLQGVLKRIPFLKKVIEHPIFIVTKNRFAPPANVLHALYHLPVSPLSNLLLARANLMIKKLSRSSSGSLSPASFYDALKDESSDPKHRMVIDYQFNEAIADWPFSYCSLGRMLSSIRPGSFVGSVDISAAFVLIPAHPEDSALLAMRLPASGKTMEKGRLCPGDHYEKFEQQRNLFGASHLPALFSTLSAEFVVALKRRAVRYCPLELLICLFFLAYMDDIFVFGPTKPLCETAFNDLHVYMASIGAKLNEKTRVPAQTGIPILGIEVNTLTMTVSLPLDKAYSCGFMCALALNMIEAGLQSPDNFWAKLTGKLCHAAFALTGGAGRLARIRHAILSSQPDPTESSLAVPLKNAPFLQESLLWWLHALTDSPPSARLFISCATSPEAQIRTKSDASGSIGASIHCADNVLIHVLWTSETTSDPSIQLKELYPIVLFIERYGPLMRGMSLPFGTDNLPNVYGVNKQSTRDRPALEWLVYLCDLADYYHILLLPSWLPREANVEADVSSKARSPEDVAQLYPHFTRVLRSDIA